MVVKKAARIPSELLPLVIFHEYLWLNLFFAGILIGIVWSLIRLVNNILKRPLHVADKIEFNVKNYNFSVFLARQSELRQYGQVFIDTWLLFLSIPVRRFTRAQNERLFISTVSLVSMIFVSIYQSGLATVFVRPLYFKDINSLAQLDASGQMILVKYAGFLTDVFPNDSTNIIRSLHGKMRLVETKMPALEMVRDKKNVATITRKSTIFLDNSEYFMKKELHLIEKECPKNYFVAYMVGTSSVFLPRINEILHDIHRFGFIMKWIEEINYKNTLINIQMMKHQKAPSKTLSLENLKFPFIVLICGNSLSVVLWIVEMMIDYIGRRKRRLNNIKRR